MSHGRPSLSNKLVQVSSLSKHKRSISTLVEQHSSKTVGNDDIVTGKGRRTVLQKAGVWQDSDGGGVALLEVQKTCQLRGRKREKMARMPMGPARRATSDQGTRSVTKSVYAPKKRDLN